MLAAGAEGALDTQSCAGRRLPPGGGGLNEPGSRIMAEAGALPEEIVWKKKVAAQRAHLVTLADPVERNAAVKDLSDMLMRQSIADVARRRFLRE